VTRSASSPLQSTPKVHGAKHDPLPHSFRSPFTAVVSHSEPLFYETYVALKDGTLFPVPVFSDSFTPGTENANAGVRI
jgi:hypothetical protein